MPGTEQVREWAEKTIYSQDGTVSTKTVHTKVTSHQNYKVEVSSSNGKRVEIQDVTAEGIAQDVVNKLAGGLDGLKITSTISKNGDVQKTSVQLPKEITAASAPSASLQKYLHDASAAEEWMAQKKMSITAEHRGKDELSAQSLIKKDEAVEIAVNEYTETIRQLGEAAAQLAQDNPESEVVVTKQAHIEKVYADLKGLVQERRRKLEEAIKLFMLNRKIDDLKRWFSEREFEASSSELGKDYEDVTVLVNNFKDFAKETETLGDERMASVEKLADELLAAKHSDGATIAEWKDSINESWADLLELIDSRTQALVASQSLHKYYHDCEDVMALISAKQAALSDEIGRDATSVSALQRKHVQFLQELKNLQSKVDQIKVNSAKQQAAHAGDKAKEITRREAEIIDAWTKLEGLCAARKTKLDDTGDLIRFFNLSRNLMMEMDDVIMQIHTSGKPNENVETELLIKNQQNLKSEMDSREDTFSACFSLSDELLSRKHYASAEIKEKVQAIKNQRNGILKRLEERVGSLKAGSNGHSSSTDAPTTTQTLTQSSLVKSDKKTVDPSLEKGKSDRSKSVFRSFRKKRTKPATLPVSSASDDESNIEKVKERSVPTRVEVLETMLVRKHDWESMAKKAGNRSWEKVYVVLRGSSIYFYKDQKSYKLQPSTYLRGENPVALVKPYSEVASDYTKKKHVFRLKLANGAEYLFQAKDDEEMCQWVGGIQNVAHKEKEAARLAQN